MAAPVETNDARGRGYLAGLSAERAHELRLPSLRVRRQLKMSRDAHAYVRGSTELFYRWLSRNLGIVPQGPRIWICGDAHVGNLGPIAAVDARVEVELRDLDQTVYGNPAHDLIRLALSLSMAARSSDLPGVVTARLIEELMSGYLEAILDPTAEATPQDSASVRFVVRQALRRRIARRYASWSVKPCAAGGAICDANGSDERPDFHSATGSLPSRTRNTTRLRGFSTWTECGSS